MEVLAVGLGQFIVSAEHRLTVRPPEKVRRSLRGSACAEGVHKEPRAMALPMIAKLRFMMELHGKATGRS